MMKKLMAALLAAMMLLTLAVTAALAEDGILRPGDSGDEVAAIQRKLIELEYMEGEATGEYDEATEAAVRLFQQEHSLLVTGMADEVTRRILEPETEHYSPVSWARYWAETEEGAWETGL